jgi:hypothetical protein
MTVFLISMLVWPVADFRSEATTQRAGFSMLTSMDCILRPDVRSSPAKYPSTKPAKKRPPGPARNIHATRQLQKQLDAR